MNTHSMTPDEQFTFVFKRLMDGWSEVWSFREVAALGLPACLPYLVMVKAQFLDELEGRPDFRKIVREPDKFSKDKRELASRTAIMSTESARVAVDSASLIFMHSIVDGAAMGF